MPIIKEITALEVLDSRGNPTIQVELKTQSGAYGRFIVPSGASTGEYEAVELRDGDKQRYNGKGVLKAVSNVNQIIAPKLVNKFSVENQREIDEFLIDLDGTKNKGNLGANAVLGVSVAVARARANFNNVELYEELLTNNKVILPTPMMNIINGGAHADSGLDFQEFMIMPISAKTFSRALQMGAEIFHELKKVLSAMGHSTGVGDEGGFAPRLNNNRQAIEVILKAVESAGYKPGEDVALALDVASSEFFDRERQLYLLKSENKELTTTQLIDFYEELINEFPIVSIEDGLDQNDWEGYKEFTKRLGNKLQIMGDDFFVTNTDRLRKGIEGGMCNSILIKVNQIGTLTETLDTINMAHKAGYTTVISHRSGETEDTTIADLAVATGAGQIKTGSLSRTDRIAKYNRLLNIEHHSGGGVYLGGGVFDVLKK
jgi:enolase